MNGAIRADRKLFSPERRALLDAALPRLVEALVARGAMLVVLFGSEARGDAGSRGDLDLLAVMESDEPFGERLARLYRELRPGVAVDLLVYTPEEFQAMRHRPFLRRVLAGGKVLHEADPLREGARWLEQAEEDLRTAGVLAAAGRHYMVCFVCQQAAEKALKGLLYALGEELVLGHSVEELARRAAGLRPELEAVGAPRGRAGRLRHPHPLPERPAGRDSCPCVRPGRSADQRPRARGDVASPPASAGVPGGGGLLRGRAGWRGHGGAGDRRRPGDRARHRPGSFPTMGSRWWIAPASR